MLLTLLIVQVGIQISIAQFPTVCMRPTPLSDKECCPDFGGSKCGSEDGRGRCETITLPEERLSVRDAWPYYFDRVCICNHNFSGYDCGRCKYGHYGVNCNSSKIVDRRPISEYSQREWEDYVNILAATKKHQSGYSVFLEEPSGSSDPLQLPLSDDITLYNLFVWQHHYPAKDSENNASMKDYAHESTGFPTWHRQFLLWFEWEVQYMLEDMGREDYYMFRIPYWDWRKEKQTDDNSPFKSSRLGETVMNRNGLPQVHGELYSNFLNNWQTVCWQKEEKTYGICNPQELTGQLQRCPLKESCSSTNKLWPSSDDVNRALSIKEYDNPPFNRIAAKSFRNQLEGFMLLSNDKFQTCRDNGLCKCDDGNLNCTDGSNGIHPGNPIQRLLHNSIHIILGLGYFGSDAYNNPERSGVMADVAASANDPIFLNHHAMVDCIFETWLQKNPNAQYPTHNNKIPPGHHYDDYIVPFFPPYKHSDMFTTANNFGYRCTIESNQSHDLRLLALLVLIIIIPVVLVIGYRCCICCYRRCKKEPSTKQVDDDHNEKSPLHTKSNTSEA